MKHIFLFIGLFVSIYSYLCKSSLKTKPDSLTNQGLPGIRCKGMEKIMIFKLGIDVANDAAENVRDT